MGVSCQATPIPPPSRQATPVDAKGPNPLWQKRSRRDRPLTHVELPYKAGHIVMLEVFGKHLLGKLALVKDMEAVSTLQAREEKENEGQQPALQDDSDREAELRLGTSC